MIDKNGVAMVELEEFQGKGNRQDRLDSLGERGKHRQAEGGFRCETYRFAPGVIQVLATTNPVAFRGRECDNDGPVAAEAACEDSQGERPSGRAGSGLVRQPWRSERYSGLPKRVKFARTYLECQTADLPPIIHTDSCNEKQIGISGN